jgi:hypothetical protein
MRAQLARRSGILNPRRPDASRSMVASVKFLKAATATVEYFEADGYYARGDPEHRRASRWYGGLADELGPVDLACPVTSDHPAP